MFIWLFHRISGVALIILIGIKLVTGFFLLPLDGHPDLALTLHRHPVMDILIVVLFTFHSLYGIRTLIMDFGFRREKVLFWASNITATLLSIFLIILYYRFL